MRRAWFTFLVASFLPMAGCQTPQSPKECAAMFGHAKGINALAISPDGTILASASEDTTIRLWDLGKRTELATLRGGTSWVNSLAFAPDGKTLASAGRLKLWDIATRTERITLTVTADAVAFTPDGNTVASGGERDGAVRLWDVGTGRDLGVLKGHTNAVSVIVFSSDGKTMASSDSTLETRLWDVVTQKERMTLAVVNIVPGGGCPAALAFSPDGKTLASIDEGVTLWNTTTGEKRAKLTVPNLVYCLAFSPDGSLLAAGCDDGKIRLWDMPSGKERGSFGDHVAYVSSLVFTPDGKTLVSANGARAWADKPKQGEIKLWKVEDVAKP